MTAFKEFILILILSFIAFYVIGISDLKLSLGNFELVKADVQIPNFAILGRSQSNPISNTSKRQSNNSAIISPASTTITHHPDTTAKTILLIGDSMSEGLMNRLLEYVQGSGYSLKTVTWYGSGTRQFGNSDTLSFFIHKFHPNFIIVSLGTNEMLIPHIGKQHRESIDRILDQIGSIPFIWVGPPSWKKDTGISDLIDSMVGSKRFYPSKHLELPRREDGIHPTRPGFVTWADSLSHWIQDSSANPIRLRLPSKTKINFHPDLVVLRQN